MTLEEKFNSQRLGDRLSTLTYSELDQIARQFKRERDELRAKLDHGDGDTERMDSPTWPHVLKFAKEMERKLELNRHKGDREGWIKDEPWSLYKRIEDETHELSLALASGSPREVTREAADVANFAMMTADSFENRAAIDAERKR